MPLTLSFNLVKKRLKLPTVVAEADPLHYEHSLLIGFGLPNECADLLVSRLQLLDGIIENRCKAFVGRPKNLLLGLSCSDSLIGLAYNYHPNWNDIPDNPQTGYIAVDGLIKAGLPRRVAERDFGDFYMQMNQAMGLPLSKIDPKKAAFIRRDLTVYAFRDDKTWTAADLDIQLGHMGFPLLAATKRRVGRNRAGKGYTEAKDARRKIVCIIGKLLRECRDARFSSNADSWKSHPMITEVREWHEARLKVSRH